MTKLLVHPPVQRSAELTCRELRLASGVQPGRAHAVSIDDGSQLNSGRSCRCCFQISAGHGSAQGCKAQDLLFAVSCARMRHLQRNADTVSAARLEHLLPAQRGHDRHRCYHLLCHHRRSRLTLADRPAGGVGDGTADSFWSWQPQQLAASRGWKRAASRPGVKGGTALCARGQSCDVCGVRGDGGTSMEERPGPAPLGTHG